MSEARKRLESAVRDRLGQIKALGADEGVVTTIWVPIADLREILAEITRLRSLVEEAVKVMEPLVTFLSAAEDLQNSPHRGEWGVECALCMGELVEADEKRTLAEARSLLTKMKEG